MGTGTLSRAPMCGALYEVGTLSFEGKVNTKIWVEKPKKR